MDKRKHERTIMEPTNYERTNERKNARTDECDYEGTNKRTNERT